jgi:hypothetical protein
MPGDEPCPVVTLGEFDERRRQLLERAESPNPQQVLFQASNEALGDATTLGLAHERERGFDSQASDFALMDGPNSAFAPVSPTPTILGFSRMRP